MKKGIELLSVMPLGVQQRFLRNLYAKHGGSATTELFKSFPSFSKFIDRTLHWDNTPEGHTYWLRVQSKNFKEVTTKTKSR